MNAADVCPALTVTLDGTVRLELLDDKGTENPPAGAAAFSVTVQDVLAGVLRLVDVQDSELNWTTVMVPEPPLLAIEFPLASDATTLVI